MVSTALPLLKLDKNPEPKPDINYKKLDNFVARSIAYQWSIGYNIKTTPESSDALTVLRCEQKDCPFQLSAESRMFGDQQGWTSRTSGFNPLHNHTPPPYLPLNIEAENSRRSAGTGTAFPLVKRSSPLHRLLDSIDPTLLVHYKDIAEQGRIDLTPERKFFEIREDLLVGVLAMTPSVTALGRMQVVEGFKKAKARWEASGGRGEIDGSLYTKEEYGRVEDWVRRTLGAGVVGAL